MVVDDETGVRELLKEVLTPIGYSVETIAEATIARDKLSAGEAYDIILADIRMPGMSGIELYSLIVDKKPEMKNKVIFITGDNMSPDIISFLHKNNLPGLSKPFDLQALEEKIDLILNSD
jgi:CheY-like chemotaxis protein